MGGPSIPIKVRKSPREQEKAAWRRIRGFHIDEIQRKREQLRKKVQERAIGIAADIAISIAADILNITPAIIISKTIIAAYEEYRRTKNTEKAIKAGVQEASTTMVSDSAATVVANSAGFNPKDFTGIVIKNALSKTFKEICKQVKR